MYIQYAELIIICDWPGFWQLVPNHTFQYIYYCHAHEKYYIFNNISWHYVEFNAQITERMYVRYIL